MKKILIIIIGLLTLVACKPKPTLIDVSELTIYTINDFHGDVLDPEESLSIIGNFLIKQKEKNPNTLIISAGDMFQGTAISNITRGDLVVEVMNYIGFDAMTIGNHEFDWGTEVISNFKDGKEVDANFPFLAANIYEKASNQRVPWASPYTVTTRGDVKIGIIGLIGQSLTSTISPSIIKDYYFTDEYETVQYFVPILRLEEKCDVVILSIHGDSALENQLYANMSGDYQVDAVINGHTHRAYNEIIMGSDNIPMPVVQASSDGRKLGKITIKLDDDNKITSGTASIISVSSSLASENQTINNIVSKYEIEVNKITNEVLGVAGKKIGNSEGGTWAVNALQLATNADVAIINSGGIRSNAFPINANQNVLVANIWQIMPFDNVVKTVYMTVDDFLYSHSQVSSYVSSNATLGYNIITIGEQSYQGDDLIYVATIDYLFDNPKYRFLNGDNPLNTEILFRDLLIDNLRNLCRDGAKWYGNAN